METETPKIETKAVKHKFTVEELNVIGGDLAQAFGSLRSLEAEFDQVKASYKAKQTEAEAKIDSLSMSRMNGFEIRNERCEVVLYPKERKKHFYLASAMEDYRKADGGMERPVPVLTEDMTAADFEQDLIRAESKFEAREEITLFPPAGNDCGIMVVGRFKDKWFAALRVKIGQRTLDERLDTEQPCSKKRADMIKRAAKRLGEWLFDSLGKDAAKGFEEPIAAAVEAHKEREE
jgi:hypothetical protein